MIPELTPRYEAIDVSLRCYLDARHENNPDAIDSVIHRLVYEAQRRHPDVMSDASWEGLIEWSRDASQHALVGRITRVVMVANINTTGGFQSE